MNFRWAVFLCLFCLACTESTNAPPSAKKQIIDKTFSVTVRDPAFADGNGPLVLVDEGHNNFHTASGRYYSFARLLNLDGYSVKPLATSFSKAVLKSCDILVISNALNQKNQGGGDKWQLPTPSAFTEQEISVVINWVRAGGSLLLIADHMPFPGAAADLAREFGILFTNSFAWNEKRDREIIFRRTDKTLPEHVITAGRTLEEKIDSVATFTGQAFLPDAGTRVDSLLVFRDDVFADFPQKAWEFSSTVPDSSIKGWLQGAVLEFGQGRVAIFGDAAMFTTQKAAGTHAPMGFNAPEAKQNGQFILNVMHWLSRILN